MNNVLTDYARTEAPEAFAACIRSSCVQAAAQQHMHPRRIRSALLLAAVILLLGMLIAAVVNRVPADLFSEETGFMLPAYEWGSSASLPRETSITFLGYTADVLYEYENDGLTAVSLLFTTPDHASRSLPSSLPGQIAAAMTAVFGEPEVLSSETGSIDADRLRQALREYLGYSDPTFSEAEKIRSSLLESGADTELADRAYESVSNSDRSVLLYRWMHEPSSTAAYLTVSLTDAQEIHTLKLSLACFER